MDKHRARPVAPGCLEAARELTILHVVESTTAGVGRHVLDLSLHMHQAGLDVTVACPRVRRSAEQDTAFVDRLRAAGVPTTIVPMRRSIHLGADLRAYSRLLALIRQRGFDVVHAHSSKAGAVGRLAARRAGAKAIVYTPHAFAFSSPGHRALAWLYRAIERWLGHHASDAVICVSRSELALARQEAIAPTNKLVMIENAIDASVFSSPVEPTEARSALGLTPDQPVFGYVGRLAPQKGLQYLVEAAQRVVSQRADARFVLVGEGELYATLQQMIAERHLANNFVLTGYRTDVPRILAALDVFVLPSIYEGLSYTLMEAMAAGRAVIATDVTGNRDLVRHRETGLLVPPRDASALAEAMLHLLSAPEERARLGQAGQVAVRSHPTPEQMMQQVIELYTRIVEAKEA